MDRRDFLKSVGALPAAGAATLLPAESKPEQPRIEPWKPRLGEVVSVNNGTDAAQNWVEGTVCSISLNGDGPELGYQVLVPEPGFRSVYNFYPLYRMRPAALFAVGDYVSFTVPWWLNPPKGNNFFTDRPCVGRILEVSVSGHLGVLYTIHCQDHAGQAWCCQCSPRELAYGAAIPITKPHQPTYVPYAVSVSRTPEA